MKEIILHVTYRCVPGKAEEFVRALKESGLQAEVRAEEGCLQYDFTLSCEAEDTVILLERWSSAEALAAHAKAPHMQKGPAIKEGRVLSTTIERFE